MRWAGNVARVEEERKVFRVLAGKSDGKRPLGKPWRRWEGGLRVDLVRIGWEVWSGFSWLRIGTSDGLL
jgi:hypothetical protein